MLPYDLVAGVVPCPRGWLVAGAKVLGATLAPELPRVMTTFEEVLDDRPAFSIIGLYAPVGRLDDLVPGGRSCEREARALLGTRRGAAIHSSPPRVAPPSESLNGQADLAGQYPLGVPRKLLERYNEVDRDMAPYRQRTVFEVHPELTFYQLNEDQPLRYRKRSPEGREERRSLLLRRIGGVDRVLDARLSGVRRSHLADAAACMWTARRVLGRAMSRLPLDPEWDALGLRMEFVR
jgi:predicted RNase H-like nuclease